jgi:hypothetical protein
MPAGSFMNSPSADRDSARPSAANSSDWEATRVQTQIVRVAGEGLATPQRDIGREVGPGVRELFIACDPADAMQQQFDHLRMEHVAVHDLGSSASRKLLESIAVASQRRVQRLAIRRPGGGTQLAAIDFVDCVASNGVPVRVYGTSIEADTATRQALANVLLANARLGVLLVGNLPAHALAGALDPLRESVRRGGWSCRRLLLMPLAPVAALPNEVLRLRAATGIDASPTPQVTRPADVWTLLCGAWNALHMKQAPAGTPDAALPLLGSAARPAGHPGAAAGPAADAGPALHRQADVPADPFAAAPPATRPPAASAPLPMPVVGAEPPSRDAPLARYLHDLSHLAGVVSVCAFDLVSGEPAGHAGARPGPQELAQHGGGLLTAALTASRSLGLGAALPDMTITLGQHHLLLRPLPAHPGMALHVILDKPHATLALVLVQLRRLDEELVAATRALTGAR